MVLERPDPATCKKENLIESYYQQSNPFINGLSGFNEFPVMIKSYFLHLQLLVFGLGFYYWICFVSFWNGGNTGEYYAGSLNTDKCNHFIHSGIPGKALIPIYQESRDSGPKPSPSINFIGFPLSYTKDEFDAWFLTSLSYLCLWFEGMIHSNSVCKSQTVTLRAWHSLQNRCCAAVTQLNWIH